MALKKNGVYERPSPIYGPKRKRKRDARGFFFYVEYQTEGYTFGIGFENSSNDNQKNFFSPTGNVAISSRNNRLLLEFSPPPPHHL